MCCLGGGDSSCLLTSSLTPPTREQLPSVSKAARNPQKPGGSDLACWIPERFVNLLDIGAGHYIDQGQPNAARFSLNALSVRLSLRMTVHFSFCHFAYPFLFYELTLSSGRFLRKASTTTFSWTLRTFLCSLMVSYIYINIFVYSFRIGITNDLKA